jgi:hypothetical protein
VLEELTDKNNLNVRKSLNTQLHPTSYYYQTISTSPNFRLRSADILVLHSVAKLNTHSKENGNALCLLQHIYRRLLKAVLVFVG